MMWPGLLWAWLKRWWWVLAGGALALLGAIFGGRLKKRPVIALTDEEKRQAELEAEERAAEEVTVRDVAKAAAEKDHQARLQGLTDSEKRIATELENDPEATNAFLKKTGQDVREP